jgi:limonene-1,2-epoxide hydrolase
MQKLVKRRTFLANSARLSAVSAIGATGLAEAADWTGAEKANVQVVNDFCAAWATRDAVKLAAFFADAAVYRVTETAPPLSGREKILERFQSFVRARKVEFQVIETFAKGPLVVNERFDTFTLEDRTNRYHLAGMFFVKDGKIVEWTDYVIPA